MIVVKPFVWKGRWSKWLHNLAMAVLDKVVQHNYRRT